MPAPPPKLDRAGFPMIWVDAIGAYLHWLPVTKVQFEIFLCDRPDARFDQDWYDGVLKLNRRITPRQIDASNYCQAILTGILPAEAQAFADWCGEQDGDRTAIPTRDEWFNAYKALREEPAIDLSRIEKLDLTPRARIVVQKMAAAAASGEGAGRTVADQMLMRRGVLEWVQCPGERAPWGAFGRPSKQLGGILINLEAGQMSVPTDLGQRLTAYGLRLLKKGG